MTTYLVGESKNTWNFERAYEVAADGDTIQFEEGYEYESDFFEIAKSLHFVGNITDIDGNITFSNTIFSRVRISGGVTVQFSKLWFKVNSPGNNMIVSEHSKVELNCVCFENTDIGNTYPIFYAENSGVIAKKMWIHESVYREFYFRNSTVHISDSVLNVFVAIDSNTELVFENVTLESDDKVIYSKNSRVRIESSVLIGAPSDLKQSAIWAEQSHITLCNSKIEQPGYDESVVLKSGSSLYSTNDHITSVQCFESRVVLDNSVIREEIVGSKMSYIVALNQVAVLGENSGIVDIYLGNHSTLVGDQLRLFKESNPIVRICENSLLKVRELCGENIVKELDETSRFIHGMEGGEDRRESGKEPLPDRERHSPDSKRDSRDKLNRLIGLERVKIEINKMIGIVDFNNLRIRQGLEPEKMALHSVFMGNPGTGKTMVARLIGEILYESGVLPGKEFIFVEASEADLVSSNVGGTAEQTQKILDKARGGILFIDEAYSLNKKDASINHGQEAINTILKYMEDHRDDIMIIFAGYTKEMEQFLKTNPGLESRVPNKFLFEDYTGDQIVEMGKSFLYSRKYTLEDERYYERNVNAAYRNSLDKSNARWIRNFNESVIKALANRVFTEKSADVTTVRNCDIDEVLNIGKYIQFVGKEVDALETLDGLVGIPSVKEKVRQFISMAELNKKREEQGYVSAEFTLHSKFLGNPGTGKTTVARIVGNILYQKGIIPRNKFIEVSRSDLVAGYLGQTAIKTREVLESALGGVLFIDEAYALNNGGNNDFGLECIDEILKFMEDHRRDMVIIFAGYTEEMEEFLKLNSGLNSRVPNTFVFEDYTSDEIVAIGLMNLDKYGYIVDRSSYSRVVKESYERSNDHSNGRWIRNFNEDLIRQMSSRVGREDSEDLNTITEEDLKKMC